MSTLEFNLDCIVIPLSRGYTALIAPEDADLAEFKWQTTGRSGNWYIHRSPSRKLGKRKLIKLSRLIVERMLGRPLVNGEVVDHISGSTFDNRRCNLRLATYQGNAANRKRSNRNKSGYKGITRNRYGTYNARIILNGHFTHLGTFPTAIEAHEAYKKAATKHFGEFARFE